MWAHMQRQRELMSPELQKDLDELLSHSMKVSQASWLRKVQVRCDQKLLIFNFNARETTSIQLDSLDQHQ